MRIQSMVLALVFWCLGSLVRAAVPTITSFTPTSGPVGTVVTVTGTYLAAAPTMAVNGTPASVVNVKTITITIAPGTTTGPITITTPDGTVTSAGIFTVIQPPSLTSFTPTSGPAGTVVTVTGTNFTWVTVVKFNGKAATFSKISDTALTATVPAGATTGKISVISPAGMATSASNFYVPPTITSFTPTSGPIGKSVGITGTNFTGVTAIAFNGVSATTFTVSATYIRAIVPTGATTGVISITAPGGTATSHDVFTIIQPPTFTSFTPTSGPVGTVVRLTGTNLTWTTAVKFYGKSAVFSITNDSELSATVPADAITGKISVSSPAGTATSTGTFTVIPPPTISSFTPSSGLAGTVVTLTGTNLTGTTAVTFNGTPATTITNVTATSLKAILPAGATTGPISVTTPGGTATSASNFFPISVNSTDGAAMVWVPGGTFTMGTENDAFWDGPHTQQVTLSGYWIYKYEVTVAQYRAFCTATSRTLPPFPSGYSWTGKSGWDDPALQQHPIVNVSWYDAKAYADWAGVNLPTEAQWEYVAGGPQGNNYPWGGTATAFDPYNSWDQAKYANIYSSGGVGKSTWPVGSFPAGASWCGVQDLAGNAWEWCLDWYGNYSSTPVTNPTGPVSGSFRVLRGGSWDIVYAEIYCRSASRYYDSPADIYWNNCGFRCVSFSPDK